MKIIIFTSFFKICGTDFIILPEKLLQRRGGWGRGGGGGGWGRGGGDEYDDNIMKGYAIILPALSPTVSGINSPVSVVSAKKLRNNWLFLTSGCSINF